MNGMEDASFPYVSSLSKQHPKSRTEAQDGWKTITPLSESYGAVQSWVKGPDLSV